jgi:hypothetical protein
MSSYILSLLIVSCGNFCFNVNHESTTNLTIGYYNNKHYVSTEGEEKKIREFIDNLYQPTIENAITELLNNDSYTVKDFESVLKQKLPQDTISKDKIYEDIHDIIFIITLLYDNKKYEKNENNPKIYNIL